MKSETAFGAAFLVVMIILAYCIFILPADDLDLAAASQGTFAHAHAKVSSAI